MSHLRPERNDEVVAGAVDDPIGRVAPTLNLGELDIVRGLDRIMADCVTVSGWPMLAEMGGWL